MYNQIKEDTYIFFCGVKDNKWIQEFGKKALALANDPVIKEKKISIELFCIGKDSKGDDDVMTLGRFWNKMENLFFSKETEHDSQTQDIQKLLSFKNESGWATLSKGSKVVVSGAGTTILKVLEEFEKWKEYVRDIGFESCFKKKHDAMLPC